MDNNTLHDNFRKQLTNVHALTVLTVSLFEIIGYIILIISEVEEFSYKNLYLWLKVVLPIVVNFVTHIIARSIVTHKIISRARKNTTIITAALITSFIVAILHKEYIITSCAFVFPMILSAMFNDKKLLNASFFTALFILVCVGIAFKIDHSATLVTSLNLFILVGFAFVSYLCGIISINFSKLNYTTIQTQAENNNKLRDDVLRDQMTGLYNHNAFVQQLQEEITNFKTHDTLFLAMIDVDDFKAINDSYGHDCGDKVLIFIANALQRYCDKTAIPYRYGGEEFAIIFKQKTTDEVLKTMNDLLKHVSTNQFDFTNTAITFSAGISKYIDGLTSEQFFEMADKSLYQAKKEGKNRILVNGFRFS